MEAIKFLPEYIHLWWLQLSQTIIASLIGTIFFALFTLIYTLLRRNNPHNKFTNLVDVGIEEITLFFQELGGNVPLRIVKFIVFIFFYILWCNIIGLLGDMFVLVIPGSHFYFRPVSTDVFFNMTIAFVCVVWSIIYGFQNNWSHYIEKYIGYKGLGIVPKVTGIASFIGKIFDIVVWLFIGLIEIVWEIAKILSLSLRLFGNILAWMVLLGLIVFATTSFIKIPLLLPLAVVFFELFVGFLQAFVFSMLVLVYFKMAWESHH
jgi:F-type H+-transporting ATPase subunit a